MDTFVLLILASTMTGVLSLTLAIVLLTRATWSNYLVKFGTPFAAGVLLIAAFRDLLPHGVEEGAASSVMTGALAAILFFFLIEKGFKSFHHHHEEDLNEPRNKTQGWLFLVGDFFHNAIDGLALGSAFLIDSGTGIIAAIALIAHDIPLEIGEFGIQLRSGFTKRQIIIRNLLASSTLLFGSIFAYQVGSEINIPMEYVYGAVAGFFIYLALSDIIPTIHTSEKARYGLQTGFLFIGLMFGATVSSFAHSYIDVGHAHHDHGHDDHDDHDEDDHGKHDHDKHDKHDHDDHDEDDDDHDKHDHDDHDEDDDDHDED